MALDRPINSADASQYQLGRGSARYKGARPTVGDLVIGSLQYWYNEGIKDVFAGVASRTGTETIFYGEDGSPLSPTFTAPTVKVNQGTSGGRPTVYVSPGATGRRPTVSVRGREAPAYVDRGTAGSVYINAPSPGSPNDRYQSTVIGPDSASMAIGPHGEVLTDLLPLFLLLSQSGRGQTSAPPPYYGGYPPPPPYYGGYPPPPPYYEGAPYQVYPQDGRFYSGR